MTLRDAASRIRRKRWESPDQLAEEIYAILVNQIDDTTGPISVNLTDPNGPSISQVSEGVDNLNIPTFDLEAPDPKEIIITPTVTEVATRAGTVRTKTYTKSFRSTLPGKIVSYQDATNTYTFDLYPDGLEEAVIRVTGVSDLQGVIVDPGIWAPAVNRVSRVRVTEHETVDAKTGAQISKNAEIELLERRHYVAFGVGAGAPLVTRRPWGSGPNYDQTPPLTRKVRAICYWQTVSGIQSVQTPDADWVPNTDLALTVTMPPQIGVIKFEFTGPITLVASATTNNTTLTIPGFKNGCNGGQVITVPPVSMDTLAWINSTIGLNWPAGSLAGTASWHIPSCANIPFTFTVIFRG